MIAIRNFPSHKSVFFTFHDFFTPEAIERFLTNHTTPVHPLNRQNARPNGLKKAYDWPRKVNVRAILRGTRRWSQIEKRSYLQDGWNGNYEFYMFEARKVGIVPLSDDFEKHMEEMDEESDTSSLDQTRLQAEEMTWANQLHQTEGSTEDSEERPFSEDDEPSGLDFDREDENKWDCEEWRGELRIAIEKACKKVYSHNEAIKSGDKKFRCKPMDIDPHWNFLLKQLDEFDAKQTVKENESRTARLIDDCSDVTSDSLHLSKSTSSCTESRMDTIASEEFDLNDAIIGIESNLLEETEIDCNRTNDESGETVGIQIEDDKVEEGEVIIIEGQEVELVAEKRRVVTFEQEELVPDLVPEQRLQSDNRPNNRFDFDKFKASLIKFRERDLENNYINKTSQT